MLFTGNLENMTYVSTVNLNIVEKIHEEIVLIGAVPVIVTLEEFLFFYYFSRGCFSKYHD